MDQKVGGPASGGSGLNDAKARVVNVMVDALRERFDIDASNMQPDQPLDGLGLDSLAFVEYVFELEKRFGIELPDVPRSLVTVDDFASFLLNHLSTASQPVE